MAVSGHRATLVVGGGLVAAALSAVLAWQTSTAGTGHQTRNEGNTFAAGGVALSTPGTTSALLVLDGLVPGRAHSSCIDVAYDGDLPAEVRLRARFRSTAAGPDDGLAPYVDVVVEETAEGAGTPCAERRRAGAALFEAGTFAELVARHSGPTGGLGAWAPDGSAREVRHYRVTCAVRDDNAAQGRSLGVDFAWEVRSA